MPNLRGIGALLVNHWGGIRWLVNDEFRDTRLAGSMSGMPATPGPGIPTVNDLDGDAMSVGAGVFSVANPNNAWGNPRSVYANVPIARRAGQMAIWRATPANNTTFGQVGLATTTTPVLATEMVSLYYSASGELHVEPGHHRVSTYTAQAYDLAVWLRANGAFYLRRTGAGAWILEWCAANNVTTPLYAVAMTYNMLYTANFVHVPRNLVTPPIPVASDSFNRANGAPGSTDGAGTEEVGGASLAWTANVGTWAISGNTAICSVLAGGLGIMTVDCGKRNTIYKVPCTRAGNEIGGVVRYVDADNYIRFVHDGTNAQIIKRVAGVETTARTAVAAYGAGFELALISQDTYFQLLYNNAPIGASVTIADAALQTSTRIGLYSTNVGNSQNYMFAFARGDANEYSILSRYAKN